jgi:hypothetical protein
MTAAEADWRRFCLVSECHGAALDGTGSLLRANKKGA